MLHYCFPFQNINVYAQNDNKKYTEKDMPAAVMESFKKAYPDSEVLGYDSGTENGKKIYEIETKKGNIYRDLEYTADGTISEIGEIIDLNLLPQDVINSIRSKYGPVKITEAEKKTGISAVTYEVIIEYKKDKYEVLLTQDGKILKQSEEEDESDYYKETGDEN